MARAGPQRLSPMHASHVRNPYWLPLMCSELQLAPAPKTPKPPLTAFLLIPYTDSRYWSSVCIICLYLLG